MLRRILYIYICIRIAILYYIYLVLSLNFINFYHQKLGCGFIGRHLVDYLVCDRLVSKVRVVDKIPPQLNWLNKHHKV